MALIFVFALSSAGLMLESAGGGLSVATVFAMICFVALASGVFVGALVQVKHWEGGE